MLPTANGILTTHGSDYCLRNSLQLMKTNTQYYRFHRPTKKQFLL